MRIALANRARFSGIAGLLAVATGVVVARLSESGTAGLLVAVVLVVAAASITKLAAKSDQHLRLARMSSASSTGFVPVVAFDASQAGCHQPLEQLWGYVERDIEANLIKALRMDGVALLVGPSMAGKSRLGHSCLRRVMPSEGVVLRLNSELGSLQRLIEQEVDPGADVALWLDDLDRCTAESGVDLPVITSARKLWQRQGHRVWIVSTLRAGAESKLIPTGDLKPPGHDLYEWLSKFRVDVSIEWTKSERERAIGIVPSDVLTGAGVGVSLSLGGAPGLLRYFQALSADTYAHQIVTWVAVWHGLGMFRAMPTQGLKILYEEYSDASRDPLAPSFEEALKKAAAEVEGSSFLRVTHPGGDGFMLHDLVLDHLTRDAEAAEAILALVPPDLHDETFAMALAVANPVEAAQIGFTNMVVGHPGRALAAYRAAAEAGLISAMNDLGFVLKQTGELKESERWTRTAADRGYVLAMNNLGLLYMERDEVREAKVWFERAAQEGYHWGIYHLGVACEKLGDTARAVEHFERAASTGNYFSMNSWAIELQRRGDFDAARYWYTKSLRGGNLVAVSNLLSLLHKARDSQSIYGLVDELASAGYYVPLLTVAKLLADDYQQYGWALEAVDLVLPHVEAEFLPKVLGWRDRWRELVEQET